MRPYLTTHFGNPSSSHHYAEQPRRALATARQQVARLIGAAARGDGNRMTFRSRVGSVAADRPLYADTSSSVGRARSGARCGKDG